MFLHWAASIDCEWNAWVVGRCSATCGTGIRTRTRTKQLEEQNEGKPCVGNPKETETCKIKDCAGN